MRHESRRALRQSHDGACRGARARCDGGRAARGHGSAAPEPRPGVRGHAAVARRRERAVHAARALYGCRGAAGDGDRARAGARPARDRARQPDAARAAARGPALLGRPAADRAGREGDVRAAARSGDPIAGGGALPGDRGHQDVRVRRGCPPARRARERRDDHDLAQAPRPGLPGAPRNAHRVPGAERHAAPRGARSAGAARDGPLPRRRAHVLADRPRARAGPDERAERRRAGRRGAHLDHAAGRRGCARGVDPRGHRRPLARRPPGDDAARARRALERARRHARRPDALAALGRTRAARALARARPPGARALRRRRRHAGALPAARSAGAGRDNARSRDRAGAAARRGCRGDAPARPLGRARLAGARGARDRESIVRDRGTCRRAGSERGERPADARAWIEWLSPAFGDPSAVFLPLADALRNPAQRGLAKRVRRAARLAGDARRAAFRRLDERLGAGGLGAIPLLRANFSTPISSMLVGRGTHPVFDVDLALLTTRP